jgi:hypothetical protein
MAGTGRREAGGVDWEGSLWVRTLVGITQGETETSPSEDKRENLFRILFFVGMGSCLVGAPCSVISAWDVKLIRITMCGG